MNICSIIYRHFQIHIRTSHTISSLKVRKTVMNYPLEALIRHVADDTRIQLRFLYGDEHLKDKMFNFSRCKNENLGVFLTRIKKSIDAGKLKKLKKKKSEGIVNNTTLPVALYDSKNVLVSEDLQNHLAWNSGNILVVGDKQYYVRINVATVKSLMLPKSIMSGFSVYPNIELEFGLQQDSGFEWYRSMTSDEIQSTPASPVTTDSHWQKCGTNFHYFTKPCDIGRYLKIVCSPKLGQESGPTVEMVSKDKVEASPGPCPFEIRHFYTQEFSSTSSFRVVSYNILADLYADSEHSRTVLFPYCPPYALHADYRKQLILKEILGYHADVICLQEVDKKLFFNDLQPVLSSEGVEGHFFEKGTKERKANEGLTCFVNSKKFSVSAADGFILGEEVQTNPLFKTIFEKICENEQLKERILIRSTSLQVLQLDSLVHPNRTIFIGNTHLYFHPNADHIRLLQSAVCIKFLENKVTAFKEKWPEKSVSVMFCGDFNSCPDFAVYELMTTGSVPPTSSDWMSAPAEAVDGMTLSQNLCLASACGTPAYTNYTPFFNGCLDYIFYQPSVLNVDSWVPLPSHEEVTLHTAIPSVVSPSDHLALIATFSWKDPQNYGSSSNMVN